VGLTAVMQQARAGRLDPDQRIVVVLTSGGLKDYGASRAWLPEVPAAGSDFAATLHTLEERYGLRLRP
jgi:threonine synthase